MDLRCRPPMSSYGHGYCNQPSHLARHRTGDREESAYQYARVLLRFFAFDLDPRHAFHLAQNIVTETTNDIRIFEGEEAADRIDAALRRLLDRARAEVID